MDKIYLFIGLATLMLLVGNTFINCTNAIVRAIRQVTTDVNKEKDKRLRDFIFIIISSLSFALYFT